MDNHFAAPRALAEPGGRTPVDSQTRVRESEAHEEADRQPARERERARGIKSTAKSEYFLVCVLGVRCE